MPKTIAHSARVTNNTCRPIGSSPSFDIKDLSRLIVCLPCSWTRRNADEPCQSPNITKRSAILVNEHYFQFQEQRCITGAQLPMALAKFGDSNMPMGSQTNDCSVKAFLIV
jgi:hypothetical protein